MYAALLYPDGGSPSDDLSLSVGEPDASGSTVTFMFEKPPLAEGGTLTLEIFAFKEGTAEAGLLKDAALLTGTKSGLDAQGGRITITDPMTLTPNASASAPPGMVSLKVTVPGGYELEIDGGDKDKFMRIGSSSVFTIKQENNEGISAGTYTLTFKVTKNSETLHAFADTINVLPGMCTDTWSGLAAGEALEVTEQKMSRMFYVRGSDPGWYSANGYSNSDYTPSDSNAGTFLAPFATIQKAIDTVVAANDGGDYTIYVDGTLTYGGSNANGMADFSALDKPLSLKIKPLLTDADAKSKSTLNANSLARVMCASPAPGGSLDLTLERLVLTGGNDSGGIQISGGKVSLTDCEVKGNAGMGVSLLDGSAGVLTMEGGAIGGSGASDGNTGGGIYIGTDCRFTLESGEISGNIGSGALVLGTLTLDGVEVKDNTGTGISLFDNAGCEFEMRDGVTVSGNKGGGIYVGTGDKLTMTGGEISGNSTSYGGGVCVKGAFEMSGGTIGGTTDSDKNTAQSGGGVYVGSGGTFTMGGSAKVAANNDVYLSGSGSSVAKIQVASALTASSPVATITPGAYTDGRQILSGTGITQTICAKFALASEQWVIAPDTTNNAGVLAVPIVYLNSSTGADTNSGLSAANAVKTLSKAVELFDAKNASKIYVCAAYTLASGEEGLLNRSGKDRLTLVRYDGSSDVTDAFTRRLLTVSSGTVTLSNVTLDGNKDNVIANDTLLYVSGSSVDVTIGDGAIVCNNHIASTTYGGAGVIVYDYGTLKMIGGMVTGNYGFYGGGVRLQSRSIFNMSGGTISGNTAHSGGGVYVNSLTTFTMSGNATISGNTAGRGGGVFFFNYSDFNQGTGTVADNTPNDVERS